MIPMNDLGAQHAPLRPQLEQAIATVVSHGKFINGPEVASFEQNFATYCGSDHCIGVANGTVAIEVALRAAGIGPGDEVITTAFTFFGTVEAILNVGATPVLVDVDPDSALMTVETAQAAVTDETAAVIVVHLYGQPVDLPAFRKLADSHELLLIEDAAQAHGAEFDGQRAGTVGDLATFSFFPGKNLGALGDAGAITSKDAGLAERARMLRNHGSKQKYDNELVGTNARLDTLQAAVLDVKLPHLDSWTAARRAHAAAYDEALAGVEGLKPIAVDERSSSAWHLYTLRCADRDAVVERLSKAEIASAIHYPIPLNRQRALAGIADQVNVPNADLLSRQVVSIPFYPELSARDRDAVVDALRG